MATLPSWVLKMVAEASEEAVVMDSWEVLVKLAEVLILVPKAVRS